MTLALRPRRLAAALPRSLAVPAALLLAATAMAGCGSTSSGGTASSAAATSASPSASAAGELEGTGWVLTTYADGGTEQPAVASPDDATLRFGAQGALSGSTGCNQVAGTYTQNGSALAIELGPMTLRACAEPVAAQETAVLAALAEVTAFTQEADGLQLRNAAGELLLGYEAGPATLAGTAWVATGINDGSGAVTSTEAVGTVTAQFRVDGTLDGFAGCNTYSAGYELTGTDGIALGPIAGTAKACEPPASTVEQAYLAALEKVTTYALDGWSTLTLRDAEGAIEITYRAVDTE